MLDIRTLSSQVWRPILDVLWIVFYAVMFSLGVFAATLVLGFVGMWLIKGHAAHFAIHVVSQILVKTTILLLEEGVKWLPAKWQDAIEARRPRETIDGTALPVPDHGDDRQSLPPRRSGPTTGGNPMKSRSPNQPYDPAKDKNGNKPHQQSLITMSGITGWAKASPVIVAITGVMILSLILNPLLLGLAILRQPFIFLWMELLSALALGCIVSLGLRLRSLENAHQLMSIENLNILDGIKSNEEKMHTTLEALKAPATFDATDTKILDAIRNTMSPGEFAVFLNTLIKAYEKANGGTVDLLNPVPRAVSPYARFSRRSRFDTDPI